MTAHDVVACVRRRLGDRRVGHAGTLDPLAAGVLPVAVGAYTRLLPYLAGDKEYLAEIRFGRATTTGDAAGSTTAEGPVDLPESAISAALARFVGRISQVPPAVSAVHVAGRRAYELARAGIAVELPARVVEIAALELERLTPGSPGPAALVRVACSKGTYVRSLAADIGAVLDAPAHLAFLLRTRSGPFRIADSLLLTAHEWVAVPVVEALPELPAVGISAQEAEDLRHGRPIRAGSATDLEVGRAMRGEELVAIIACRDGALWPRTVLPAQATPGDPDSR